MFCHYARLGGHNLRYGPYSQNLRGFWWEKEKEGLPTQTLDLNEFKSFKEIPVPVGQPAKPVTNRQRIKIYEERGTGRVVDDPRLEIKWKPIDKVAARVVAKAKWHDQPPPSPPKFNNMPGEKQDAVTSAVRQGRVTTKVGLTDEGYRETFFEAHSADGAMIDIHEGEVKKKIKTTEELTERARELTATIDYLATELKGPWSEFQEFIKSALGTVREQRIAMGSETRLLMGSLKEVRQFFLEETYETEIRRLSEFIDLCERLKTLKDCGFLDTVADTMLKLNGD